ncbi:hypothetical protein [Kaarinaea lacus]
MSEQPNKLLDVLLNPPALLQLLREYFNVGRLRRIEPISDKESLKYFLNTRASFVAQTSLYGYLRTRAGMRYPELFDDDPFVKSINIAKWQMWLACLSDLAVYAGGMLKQHTGASEHNIGALIQKVVDEILDETGEPEEAGDRFAMNAQNVRKRLALTEWSTITDGEMAFNHSPVALVEWAPIVDELKQLDEEIVINSVRFRWQKVRQDFRKALRADALQELLQQASIQNALS